MAAKVRFLLDGEVVETEAAATDSVLDMLRYKLRRTGTKEGCAEGDCGACTVLLGDGDGWRAVNACILFVPMLDGKALKTVESLGGDHPVQREMIARHGSQCGFCTPGFVMSLVGRSIGAAGTEGETVGDVIAGNLCRCTGYGPILDAGEAVGVAVSDERIELPARAYPNPSTADELAALLVAQPETQIIAGATDVGLWVTKQHRALGPVVFIGDIADLRGIDEADDALTLGAAVRYSEARAALARVHADLGALVRRIGGVQVRNSGTIGGNIANGSPIGDMPPVLITLGAELTLRLGDARRTIALEDFFLSYGKQDRAAGEFVERVRVPRPAAGTLVRIVKLSKRFDSDISGVCGAFALRIVDGVVQSARIAFGGMAGIPMRARGTEAAMIGQAWNAETVEAAAVALAADYAPLDDLRASAEYRQKVAANLLRRIWAEQSEPVSVLHD